MPPPLPGGELHRGVRTLYLVVGPLPCALVLLRVKALKDAPVLGPNTVVQNRQLP